MKCDDCFHKFLPLRCDFTVKFLELMMISSNIPKDTQWKYLFYYHWN